MLKLAGALKEIQTSNKQCDQYWVWLWNSAARKVKQKVAKF